MADGTLSGGCSCGKVRFTAALSGDEMDACHCSICRKWAGGPFMCVQVADVAFADEASLGVWNSSDWAERLFCRACGTPMMYRLKSGGMTVASAFIWDAPLSLPLKTEIFVDEKPATYAFADVPNQMTGAEVMAAFAGEG